MTGKNGDETAEMAGHPSTWIYRNHASSREGGMMRFAGRDKRV